MKASEALIAWTPKTDVWDGDPRQGRIQVGKLLRDDERDWTSPYAYTGGAAYTVVRDMKGWQSIGMLFIEFHTIVTRDGLDPAVAHEAFLKIDEYRQRISPDIDGAEDIPEDDCGS